MPSDEIGVLKDYEIRREHWAAAVQEGGTDLSLAEWRANIDALGRDHWLTDAQAALLRPGDIITPALWTEHLQEGGKPRVITAPGDLLIILDGGHDRVGLTLECQVRAEAAAFKFLGHSFARPEQRVILHIPRFARYPYRLVTDPRLTPPMTGDRVASHRPADAFGSAYTVASPHDDQSGLSEGVFRFIDERGDVQRCQRSGHRWILIDI